MAYLTTFLSKIFGKFVVTNQIYEIEGVPSPKSMGWVGSQVCDFFPNKTGFLWLPLGGARGRMFLNLFYLVFQMVWSD